MSAPSSTPRPLRGLGGLESRGRLSDEIYLTHMFVVFGAVRLWRAAGGDPRAALAWYLPVMVLTWALLTWALGWLIAHGFSQPCERWRRGGRPARVAASIDR